MLTSKTSTVSFVSFPTQGKCCHMCLRHHGPTLTLSINSNMITESLSFPCGDLVRETPMPWISEVKVKVIPQVMEGSIISGVTIKAQKHIWAVGLMASSTMFLKYTTMPLSRRSTSEAVQKRTNFTAIFASRFPT